jgi:hypothetical protein
MADLPSYYTINQQTPQQPEHSFYIFEANAFLREHLGKTISGTSYAQFLLDMRQVVRVITVMGITGSAYVKSKGGKDYIILKGRAGLRPVGYQGTRYLANNPTINFMTVGLKNMAKAAARATGIAIIAFIAIDIARALTGELDTFGKFAGTLGMDIVKGLASAGIGWAAAAAGTVAISAVIGATAPLWAVLAVGAVVGLGVGLLLDKLDEKFQVTQRVCRALDRYVVEAKESLDRTAVRVGYQAGRAVRDAAYWVAGRIAGSVRRRIERELRELLPRYSIRFF